MYDSKNYDGFLVDISLSLLIPQASKCRKSNDFMVCTVIRPPKDHIDFFESLDISQETSNTLKKFKETVKISDCWAFRQYEKKMMEWLESYRHVLFVLVLACLRLPL